MPVSRWLTAAGRGWLLVLSPVIALTFLMAT
jgi:hypothetical protein